MMDVNGVAPMRGDCHPETGDVPLQHGCAVNATLEGDMLGNGGKLCDQVIADDAVSRSRIVRSDGRTRGRGGVRILQQGAPQNVGGGVAAEDCYC